MYHRTDVLWQDFLDNLFRRRVSRVHWMDRLVVAGSRSERIYPRLFPGGWGDEAFLDRYRSIEAVGPIPPISGTFAARIPS